MSGDAVSQVRELKRKHREKAILSGNPDESGFFWDKKVERDLKQNKVVQGDDDAVRRERDAELERVRARRQVLLLKSRLCPGIAAGPGTTMLASAH